MKPVIIRMTWGGGVATCLLGSSRYSVDLGVLVVRIVERRLYLTYKQKTVIKKSL